MSLSLRIDIFRCAIMRLIPCSNIFYYERDRLLCITPLTLPYVKSKPLSFIATPVYSYRECGMLAIVQDILIDFGHWPESDPVT